MKRLIAVLLISMFMSGCLYVQVEDKNMTYISTGNKKDAAIELLLERLDKIIGE